MDTRFKVYCKSIRENCNKPQDTLLPLSLSITCSVLDTGGTGGLKWNHKKVKSCLWSVPALGTLVIPALSRCRRSSWPPVLLYYVHQCGLELWYLEPWAPRDISQPAWSQPDTWLKFPRAMQMTCWGKLCEFSVEYLLHIEFSNIGRSIYCK